jgi:GNAT superfamily N-acetyltransferase
MMNIQIRKANPADVDQMLGLVKELAEYEKALEKVTVTVEQMLEYGFGEHPLYWALIAENEGKIIGLSLCYTRYSTWRGPRCYLEDIIITDAYRGKGIGKQLMDATINEAKEKKYSGMIWQVLDWNQPEINFYQKYAAEFDPEWINVSIEF